MARTVRDTNLETRAARLRLQARRKPYWRVLESGLHLGYRRTKEGGGSWVARRFIGEGRYSETKVGTADDLQDADGVALRSFKQAQEAARTWWRLAERREQGIAPDDGPYTVAAALDAYFGDRERRGSKGLAKDRAAARARILPGLGAVELAKLTTKRIRDWHTGLATASKLVRAGRIVKKARKSHAVDTKDADAVRARRATANRTLTVLKAALNHAFHESRIASDEAWRKTKPFRETDAPVVRFLSDDECRRIVNACDGAFRNIVKGALLTGCRYGELTRMRAGDFNAEAGTITVRESKSGKPRHVALTDEGRALFSELTVGHSGRRFDLRSGRWKGLGAIASATAIGRGERKSEDQTRRDLPHSSPHLRKRPCHARRPHGRHRGAARTFRHTHDGTSLCASFAELCRRDSSRRAPGARDSRAIECRDLEYFAPRIGAMRRAGIGSAG